jgi:hypothetical protein
VICRTQALFGKASDTSALRRLGDTAEKSAGAVVWMLVPWIQLSVQKNVDSPDPTVEVVEALKTAVTNLSLFLGKLDQLML